MSIIVKASIKTGWNPVDRKVALIDKKALSDGAYRLYGYLTGLKAADNFSDTFIIHGLGISKNTLAARKTELKKNDLIKSVQVAPRVYMLFIGNTKIPANQVYDSWLDRQDKREKGEQE